MSLFVSSILMKLPKIYDNFNVSTLYAKHVEKRQFRRHSSYNYTDNTSLLLVAFEF